MSHWVLPLVALSSIANLSSHYVESEDHYSITTDTYSYVWPWRSYKTSPHNPPQMNITRNGRPLSPGYVFMSPSDAKGVDGTYELSGTGFIMTTEGDMVFAGEERGYLFCDEWVAGMTDFRKQYYKGKPYITYWNGCNTQGAHWGHRWGRVTFIDEEYTNFTVNPFLGINTLDDANKGQIDMHEHQMTDDDTMVVTTYNNTLRDLRPFGMPAETWIAESMFYEFDIATGEVLFKWSAMDHIPFNVTHWGLGNNRGTRHIPWDWFHINSVQKVGKNYLVSARHHFSIYMVSGEDGSILWKLNGDDGGSFAEIPIPFRWQHHARAQNVTEHGMTISLFNNHVNGRKNWKTQTQALAFYLPLPVRPDTHPRIMRRLQSRHELVFSATQGSYQMDLGNGNGFVGYGKVPLVREFGPSPDGRDLRWEAWFGHDEAVMSYRAFKADWKGTPKNWDPIAIFEPVRLQRSKPGHVYVSWNGATDISHWAIFAGDDAESLEPLGVTRKMGFETTFQLADKQCVQLGAVRDGRIIRASNIACQDDAPLVFDEAPSKIGGGTDLSALQTQKEMLEAAIEDLEGAVLNMEAGIWVSWNTLTEVIIGFIAMVAAILGFRFWRDRRKKNGYQGVLGGEPFYSHSRVASSLGGLSVFTLPKDKRKVSPMIPNDAAVFDETKLDEAATVTGRQHLEMHDDGHFRLTQEDDEDEDEDEEDADHAAHSRTPFMRQASNAS